MHNINSYSPIFMKSYKLRFNGELTVAQPEVKSDLEARVEALEKKLNMLLESIKKIDKWAR